MMEAAKDSSGDERQQEWPLTPGLIGTILDVKPGAKIDAETSRRILRVLKGLSGTNYTGCITFVFEDGKVEPEGYRTSIVYIGPAAK